MLCLVLGLLARSFRTGLDHFDKSLGSALAVGRLETEQDGVKIIDGRLGSRSFNLAATIPVVVVTRTLACTADLRPKWKTGRGVKNKRVVEVSLLQTLNDTRGG